MIFTDSDIVTSADLGLIDPEVTQLYSVPQAPNLPPLVGPESIIDRAVDQVGRELITQNQTYTGYLASGPGMFANHLWSVMTTYQTGINRPKFMLNQVVAMEPNPTKTYVSDVVKQQALYLFFQSLLHRTINDRYQMKMTHYKQELREAWQRLQWSGCPVVTIPLACPGAVREYQSGTWNTSNVTAGRSGSSETGNVYDVVITYTGALYQSYAKPMNGESAPSSIVTVQANGGQLLTVSIVGLNPPNGTMPNIGVADGIYTPMAAVGWNVYVAPTGQTPVLQNSSPIPIATTNYTLPDAPVTNGMTVGIGQAADFYITYQTTVNRA